MAADAPASAADAAGTRAAGTFRVVSWNVLAHIHTHWDASAHGGRVKSLETAEQRGARHRLVAQALARLAPDAALLQEVDQHFMPLDWQADRPLPCGERLDGYTPYRSYSERGEGTVVLLRDATFQRDRRVQTAYLPATQAHGWKTACVVHALPRGAAAGSSQGVAFASVHLKWGAPDAQCALLSAALGVVAEGVPLILGGDFNTRPGDLHAHGIAPLLSSKGLRRLATPDGEPTGLTGEHKWDPGHVIDHLWASPELRVAAAGGGTPVRVGPVPGREGHQRGAWGPGPHDGSDHAWLCAEVAA